MPVDWEREAPRLAKLARLELAPAEVAALAAACEAITRDFAALVDHAAGLPPAPEDEPAPPRADEVAPAPREEVEGILAAAPRVDPATRAVVAPRGAP